MEEYESNSYKSKEEKKNNLTEKRIEKVINGSAKHKKKGKIQKFSDAFISEDISNLKSYILLDVLVPTIKKAISDIVTNGIDMVLYGETGNTRKRPASKISYGKFYDRETERRKEYHTSSRCNYDYDDIIFETRGDAESVLDAMYDIISEYHFVSIGDLYDLAAISTNNYNLDKYGWTDISGCKAVKVRDGYILKLPKAMPID